MKRKTKKTLKVVLLTVLAVALTLGVFSLVSNAVNKDEDGFDKMNLSFEIGNLDETGKLIQDSKDAIYTKNAIELNTGDELKFTIDFDSDITYALYFYDGNDEFVSKTEDLTKNYTHVAENNESVRVVIRPVFAEDVEEEEKVVKFYQILKYERQLQVEIKRYDGTYSFEIEHPNPEDDRTFIIVYEKGMTWSEWVKSEYNTYDFVISNLYGEGSISLEDVGIFYDETQTDETSPVNSNDIIDSSVHTYCMH